MSSSTMLLSLMFAVSSGSEMIYHKSLEGSWSPISLTWDGLELGTKDVDHIEWTFKASKQLIRYDGNVEKGSYSMITFCIVPGIDVINEDGGVFAGIFCLEKDELKVCYALKRGQDRPAEFTAGKGSSRVLVILKRKNKP